MCKHGGRIGLANWTPEGFIGQVFKTIGKYIPPAPGVKSPAHFIEVFRTYYGPINKTYAALDAAKREEFNNELLALIARGNRSGDGTLVLPSEYLEAVVVRN